MLIRFTVENFQVFGPEVELNMEADLRTKKFRSNIIMDTQGNTIKTAAIYGPNNTGKTCLLNAVRAYKAVLLNKSFNFRSNLFTDSPSIKIGAEFLQLTVDQYGNELKNSFFSRNAQTKVANSSCEKLRDVINLSSKDNILINTLDASEFPLLHEAKDVLRGFAESITVLSMQSLQPYKTIEMLKDQNCKEAKQIVELIKHADLDIDDFRYDEKFAENISIEIDEEDQKAKGIHNIDKLVEMFKLASIHKGKSLPSILFDSLGTKKIVSLAGYLVEHLNKGGCLFIDELDSGIHFKLSRAIVSLFNSSLNDKAQMVITTHDSSLLDIKTLFRKEQLWFTDKDQNQTYLYSLSSFTAQNSGIRLDSDLYDHYSKGLLGALPDPSLIDMLINI